MSINIKSEEAHRLARELADITGESLTKAVTVALQERLDRLRPRHPDDFVERAMAIARDCAAHLKEPYRSIDHGEMLYDDRGLPK